MPMLSEPDVERLVETGFVPVPGAFPRPVADECRPILWRKTGCDPQDPTRAAQPHQERAVRRGLHLEDRNL
jgi:hypothetical protein